MKKLLAAFALIFAFCLPVFALSACSEEEESDFDMPGDGKNIVVEELTGEEQWKQAFADTMAARKKCGSFKVKEDYSSFYTVEGIVRFDIEEHIIANEAKGVRYGSPMGDVNISAKSYIELKENSIYTYQKYDEWLDSEVYPDNGWQIGKSDHDTAEEALSEFEMATEYYVTDALSNANIGSVMSQKYATEETGEGKDLSELFSAFTYDEATKEYSANLYFILWNNILPTEMKITFADGKIAKYKIDLTFDNQGEVGHVIREVICGYTCDKITIPGEAKNGAVG